MKKRFYQLVPHVQPKDAIGQMALAVQKLCKELGWNSLIFTEKQQSSGINPIFLGPIRPGILKSYPPWKITTQPHFLLYHHSIGSIAADRFVKWPAHKKILVYHNITPPELLKDDGQKRHHAQWGLEQLAQLIKITDLEVGLSKFSCLELENKGARHVVQLPFLHKNAAFFDLSNRKYSRSLKPENPLILFVGRLEPFKRIMETILAFEFFQKQCPGAKLALVGNAKANPEYVSRLKGYLRTSNLESLVSIPGRVSPRFLNSCYRQASVLLTLSEHEGFCVPLMEAMYWGVPVVAFPSGAVEETLGSGGFLVHSREPSVVAKALKRAIEAPPEVKQELFFNQTKELKRFSWNGFRSQFHTQLLNLVTDETGG